VRRGNSKKRILRIKRKLKQKKKGWPVKNIRRALQGEGGTPGRGCRGPFANSGIKGKKDPKRPEKGDKKRPLVAQPVKRGVWGERRKTLPTERSRLARGRNIVRKERELDKETFTGHVRSYKENDLLGEGEKGKKNFGGTTRKGGDGL